MNIATAVKNGIRYALEHWLKAVYTEDGQTVEIGLSTISKSNYYRICNCYYRCSSIYYTISIR